MDSHIPLNPLCIFVFWFSCSLFECSFLIGFIIAALRAYEAQKNHPVRRIPIRGESRNKMKMFRQNNVITLDTFRNHCFFSNNRAPSINTYKETEKNSNNKRSTNRQNDLANMNPLTLISDRDRTSPYNINTKPRRQVVSI